MFKNLNPGALSVTGHQSEIIELALTYGFGGMDLNVVEFATRSRLKGVEYARRLIDSAKLKIGSFALPLDWETDDDTFAKELAKLPEYAQAAVAAGCTRCIATVLPANDTRPYHENFEFHKRRFQETCRALEPSGVRLGVGFKAAEYLRKNQAFQFVHDLDALTLLLNMVAAPNIGLLLDIWEVVVGGGSLDSVRKLPVEQIVAVHVADLAPAVGNGEIDEKSRLLPGAEGGRIDITTLLVYLKSAGYDGPVTPRPSRGIFQSRRRDLVVKQVGEAMDKVWRAAGLPMERRFVPSAASLDYNIDFGN
jgi:sugar phosphate isomerase/epimerase